MGVKEGVYQYLSAHPEFRANVGLCKPDHDILERIKAKIEEMNIKIFCADWCPDCRVQLPRFLSVILALEDVDIDLEIIEVDRDKVDGQGMAEKFDVLAIPTFIFMRDGEEIGRIIERPKESMETDILEIIE
jgi:thiol-disulfide isomerase/thioredoxin